MKSDSEEKGKKKIVITVLVLIVILALFSGFVMFTNSRKPDKLTLPNVDKGTKGAAFIMANQMLIKQMYENWLPNDYFWPTLFLDNMPNFQLGMLEVVRYNSRVLRDNLSRMRTTDKLDPLVERAFTALSNDPNKWWLPSAESKWKEAYKSLNGFHQDLLVGKSHFYPRADNLVELLNQYASLMGGANTRLINAPHDIDRVLSIEEQNDGGSKEEKLVSTNIPWYRIDDNFYYAQGISYALYESFQAIRIDFYDILIDKNSLKMVDIIIENLDRCRFEPLIVFNGSPASIFANHSLNLSGIFNDARQKINSLIVALKQG